MTRVSALRRSPRACDVRGRAEAAADGGSPAAALALLTAAAQDLEQTAPYEAATLLADGSAYANIAHGPARALELARRAVEVAGGVGGDVGLVVHARLGDALQWNGLYEEAQSAWSKAARDAAPREPRLLCMHAGALLRAGSLAPSRESAYAAAARAREAGDGDSLRDALTFQAIAEIHLGLLREARTSTAALEALAGPAASGERAEALGMRAWVDALFGDERACRARIAGAEAAAAAIGLTPSSGMAAGLLDLALGRYEDAVPHLERKLAGRSAVAAALSLRPFLDALVEACARCGRHERAGALAAAVFDAAVATRQPRYAAIALRMRGVAGGSVADLDAAVEHHSRWENRFEEGRTLLARGEALRRARRPREARDDLAAAAAAFASVGTQTWEVRARDELRAAGARIPRAASRVPLTPQEERIARLVADGLSNKEIAARLVLSPKTIEGHLRNIFGKLGATSRTQVARAVSR